MESVWKQVELIATMPTRVGLLRDVCNALSAEGIDIRSIEAYDNDHTGEFYLITSDDDLAASKLAEMGASMSEQSKDIRELRSAIASGVVSASSISNAAGSGGVVQSFKRAYAATRLPGYASGDWSVDAFGTNLKTITPLVSTDATRPMCKAMCWRV